MRRIRIVLGIVIVIFSIALLDLGIPARAA